MELAMIVRPLIEELLKHPNNDKNSFNYYNRQNIVFWPKNKIENIEDIIMDLTGNLTDYPYGNFYRLTSLEMPYYDPKIKNLKKWWSR